jgi:hypothetical protein
MIRARVRRRDWYYYQEIRFDLISCQTAGKSCNGLGASPGNELWSMLVTARSRSPALLWLLGLPKDRVALVGGWPYYFDCQFPKNSTTILSRTACGSYPGHEPADELEVWQIFARWRGPFDSGLRTSSLPGKRTFSSHWSDAASAAVFCERGWSGP